MEERKGYVVGDGILPLFQVIWVSNAHHRQALDRLFRTDRRGVSLVDCSSFHLMDTEGILEALALDADFALEGFRLLP